MISLHDLLDYAKPWLFLAGAAIVFGISFSVGDFVMDFAGVEAVDPDDISETLEYRGGGRDAARGRGVLTIAMMLPKAAVGFAILTIAVAPFVLAWILLRKTPGDVS